MNEKLNIQNLTDELAETHGISKKNAESFVKDFFSLIGEALVKDKYVKIKGLGTFKLIDVDSRESINVNTGERFEIQGHSKITFTPDNSLKEVVNKPFSAFETVVLADGVEIDAPEVIEGFDAETDETLVEEPLIEEFAAPIEEPAPAEELTPIEEPPLVEKPALDEEEPAAESIPEPIKEEPVVEETITEEPVLEEPIIEEPIAGEPEVDQPDSVEEPKAEEPLIEEPVVEEPVVEEPVVEEPAPVIEEEVVPADEKETLIAEEPVVEEPVIEEPVNEEPEIEEPVDKEPTAEESIAEEPVEEQPVKILPIFDDDEIRRRDQPVSHHEEVKALRISEEKRREISKKAEGSFTPYLMFLAVLVIIFCLGAVAYLYYPDLAKQDDVKPVRIEEPVTVTQQPEQTTEVETPAVESTQQEVEATNQTDNNPSTPVETPVPASESAAPTAAPATNEMYQQLSEGVVYKTDGDLATHTLEKGETLNAIARKYYGVGRLYTYIVSYNKTVIKDPDNVPVGTVIKIPRLVKK